MKGWSNEAKATVVLAFLALVVAILALGRGVLDWTWTPSKPTETPMTPTAIPTPQAGVTRVWEKDGSVMIYVPEGTFWMGSTESDPDAGDDEKPQHEVYLDAFWIDRAEVTNAQYQRCVKDKACSPPPDFSSASHDNYYDNPDFDNYPVIYVDWAKANA